MFDTFGTRDSAEKNMMSRLTVCLPKKFFRDFFLFDIHLKNIYDSVEGSFRPHIIRNTAQHRICRIILLNFVKKMKI